MLRNELWFEVFEHLNIRRRTLAGALALGCLLAGNSFAQDKAKGKAKSYTFHGKVEAVTDKGLTVNGEKVEGWWTQ